MGVWLLINSVRARWRCGGSYWLCCTDFGPISSHVSIVLPLGCLDRKLYSGPTVKELHQCVL